MTELENLVEIFKSGLKGIEKSKLIELLTLLKDERLPDDLLRVTLIYDIVEELLKSKTIIENSRYQSFLKEQSNTGVTWDDFKENYLWCDKCKSIYIPESKKCILLR